MIGFHPAAGRSATSRFQTSRPDAHHIIQEQIRNILANLPRSITNAPPTGEPALVRQIAVGQERFRLVLELLPPNASGERLPIATVQRIDSPDMSENSLRERFRLTRKEVRVALLLAQRRSNAEIADTLRISPHTARRHTENVMLKLNVTSRFSVEAALSGAA